MRVHILEKCMIFKKLDINVELLNKLSTIFNLICKTYGIRKMFVIF